MGVKAGPCLCRVLTSKSSGQNGRIDTASMAALRKRTALAESAAEAARAELSSAAQRAESAQLDAERYQSLHQAFQVAFDACDMQRKCRPQTTFLQIRLSPRASPACARGAL